MKEGKPFLVRVGWTARTPGSPPGDNPQGVIGETETPLLDIYETPDHIVIEADLPGVDPKAIGVRVYNNQVTLEGHRRALGEGPDAGNYLRMERCYEDFRRILQLPAAVDPERAHASYEDGVLNLFLPKIIDRRRKAVKIEVK